MSKLKTKEFLQADGLRTPETFSVLEDPDDITERVIPERCVIKPVHGTDSGGVMVLRREAGGFYDLMQRKPVALEDIRQTQRESQEKFAAQFNFHSSEVLIEEALVDEDGPDMVPPDYKVWAFNGRTALIEQVNRNTEPKSAAWYIDDFQPIEIDDVAFPELKLFQRGLHRLPRCRADILRVARIASRALHTPFVRVDTYATPDGAAIGELTLAPGPPHYGAWRFLPWFDELLGAQWAQAVNELQGGP